MKAFTDYLYKRRRLAAGMLLGFTVFVTAFALYHLPLGAVLYPSALCLVCTLLYGIWDCRRIRKERADAETIRTLTDVTSGSLPPARTEEGENYRALVERICAEQTALITESDRRYADMVEYYTAWAHQIKTPIASMRLNLQNEDSASARQQLLELFRIEQYVEMVLTFLRLDSPSTDYVITTCDLDTVVKQAVRRFSGEFIARKLSLVYEPLNMQILTDEKWLAFVIEQGLSNALKYTPSGSITIERGESETLIIRDTGIGIAAEDLPRIFEKGYTGANGRSDKRASGIGLYLCRRICDNLGHKLSIRSVPGKGTEFEIDLKRPKFLHE